MQTFKFIWFTTNDYAVNIEADTLEEAWEKWDEISSEEQFEATLIKVEPGFIKDVIVPDVGKTGEIAGHHA